MTGTRVGYARCPTDEQDRTAQRGILLGLDVAPDRIYLDQSLAAVRARDLFIVSRPTVYRVLDRTRRTSQARREPSGVAAR